MELIRSLKDYPPEARGGVLSIGNFDGVHLGHRALLGRTKQIAADSGVSSNLLSFTPHPMKVLQPNLGLKELFPIEDMIEQVELLGLDILVIEEFSLQFSQKSPQEFLQAIYESLQPSHIVVGDDFRYGSDRAGGFAEMKSFGAEHGFSVEQINPVDLGGVRMSSSMIRSCLVSGDVRAASEYLGRPFELRGTVVGGEQRGRRLGFPTANLSVQNEIIPKVGVYVTELVEAGQSWPALTNIGYRPTFEGETDSLRLSVESFVIHGDFDLYDKEIRLKFLERVRPELKFSSSDELINQIEQDVQFAEDYFARQVKVD